MEQRDLREDKMVNKKLDEKDKEKREKLLKLFKEKKGTNIETARAMIEAEVHPSTRPTLDLSSYVKDGKVDIGVISDTCFNSKYLVLDKVHTVYRHFRELGASYILHCGNVVEKFVNRKIDVENSIHADYNVMLDSFERWMPNIGIKTYFIGGKKEESYEGKKIKFLNQETGLWEVEEIDIIEDLNSYENLEFLGWNNARIKASEKVTIALASPSSGSRKPYTISYPMQKLIESYGGGEKPTIQLLGYYNKRWDGIHRDVFSLMVGTLQNQIPQQYAKQEPSHTLGALVLRLSFDKDGSLLNGWNGITVRDIPFYE